MLPENAIHASRFLLRYECPPTDPENVCMKRFFSKDFGRKFSRTLLPFILAFFFGLGLVWYPESWPFGQNRLLPALRDALMVAGIIGLAIETWSASVLVDHAAGELSERLVGYGLPRTAQELVSSVVRTKLLLRDYRAVYRIDPHPINANSVVVTTTLSYKVVNNGASSEAYAPMLAEERIYSPSVTLLEWGDKVFTSADQLDRDESGGAITWKPKRSIHIAPSSPMMPPESLEPAQLCYVRWVYSVEMPKLYSSVLVFAGLTVNPMIEFAGADDFDFEATTGDECNHPNGSGTWQYRRAFIPGQHVRVWWRPRAR